MIKHYETKSDGFNGYQEAAGRAADDLAWTTEERKALQEIYNGDELVTSDSFGTGRRFNFRKKSFIFHHTESGVNIERVE